MKSWKILLSAVAAALVVVGCGGGGSTSTTNFTNTKVRVFGDSLADSGTFGIKFTVNNASAGGAPTKIWPELVASSVGQSVCNFYNATGPATFVAPSAACTSLAVGGGRVLSGAATGGPTSPYSIPTQMATAASLLGATGTFAATELMLVDGGGNDSADLAGAFLSASAGPATYTAFLSALVPNPTLTAVLTSGPTGPAQAGGLYMQALADKFADDITTSLLNKGAKRVVLLNAPAVTNTPRFKLVLQSVAASAGTPTAANVEAAARGWTQAYNARLAARFAGDSRVAVVDFFSEFDLQVTPAGAASFGLTNVKDPVCPIVGLDAQGLPAYNFATCTAAALDGIPIVGPPAWRTYAFSDGFHPTPLGHQLLANLVGKTLTAKGWL